MIDHQFVGAGLQFTEVLWFVPDCTVTPLPWVLIPPPVPTHNYIIH